MQFNSYGTYTLYIKEVRRFLKVYHQTIIAPVVSAMIFLAIFDMALGSVRHDINGIPFVEFMAYGLVIMTIIQNAFSNSSSSLVMGKVIGYIIDILMPPLSSKNIIIAYTLGAATRGVMVGILLIFMMMPFVSFSVHHPILLVFFTISSCFLMGLAGILTGVASNSFDQNASITSYIITPLSFLSGTFYSADRLPTMLQIINLVNPFFYMIDGFRYSITGYADSHITFGIIYLTALNIIMFVILDRLIAKGWRLKS